MWSDRFSAMLTSTGTTACIYGQRRQSRAARMTSVTAFIMCLCFYFTSPSHGEIPVAIVQNVGNATKELQSRFQEIRTNILGADTLAAEYERVGFNYSPLDISNILSSDFAAESINKVLDIIKIINHNSTSTTSSLPGDCCGTSPQPVSTVCCERCESMNGLLSAITDAFSSDPSLEDIQAELMFGSVNHSLIIYPSPQDTANCVPQESNLQPWYMNMIRERPLEVVLILDLNDFADDPVYTQGLRAAAITVLDSLTRQDMVQVIMVGKKVVEYVDEAGGNKVRPVCPSSRQQLRDFIRGMTPPTHPEPALYVRAFIAAFNAFNTSEISSEPSDTLIILFTSLNNLYDTPTNPTFFENEIIPNITRKNVNHVVFSVYHNAPGIAFPNNIGHLEKLVNSQNKSGIVRELVTENDVRDYYDVFSEGNFPTQYIGRDVNSRGDPSLSLSIALNNGSELLGIFHALLPWEMLFPLINQHPINKLENSNFFIIDGYGQLLYHPLVPSDFQSYVSVATLESQAVLDKLLGLSNRSEFVVSTNKSTLTSVSVHDKDGNAFIYRPVEMTYTCHHTDSSLVLYTCVGVATEDEMVAQLKDADIESLYNDNPDRFPLYHTSDILKNDQCFDFCSISSKDQLSVQLTGQSMPPSDVTLKQVIEFLNGNPASNSWAVDGVANELGVVSVVGDTWRDSYIDNCSNGLAYYVIRRHLATPSGLYLVYPFAHLSSDFIATYSEWYILSSAHPDILTLTPPRPDVLWEAGYILSAGVAISTPPQDQSGSDGGMLAVVAADLTLLSLKVLVEDAMPLCSDDKYDCFLLDDQGNILYHDLLFTSSYQKLLDEPIFLISPPESRQKSAFQEVLVSVLDEGRALKVRCLDYLNQTVRQRLFFSFFLDNPDALVGSSKGFDYVVQNIPGTNAFFGIVKQTDDSDDDRICVCSKICQNCNDDAPGGCNCPCLCPEDCKAPHNYTACPAPLPASDQLARGVSSTPVLTDKNDLTADHCFLLNCSCKTEENDCAASRDCHWCSQESECRSVTECCGSDPNLTMCCKQSPFDELPSCMSNICIGDTSEKPDRKSDSSNDSTASIVGGVLGALLVLALVLIGTGFFLWAKFCKKGLYEDEQKENAFDFSKNKVNAKNPLENEAKDIEAAANLENQGGSSEILAETVAIGDETTI